MSLGVMRAVNLDVEVNFAQRLAEDTQLGRHVDLGVTKATPSGRSAVQTETSPVRRSNRHTSVGSLAGVISYLPPIT
jgi:hypothetical protein